MTAAKCTAQRGKTTLSSTLSEKRFIPEYMMNAAAADAVFVRQLGPPTCFWTFVPAEWTLPLRIAVEGIMTQVYALDFFRGMRGSCQCCA